MTHVKIQFQLKQVWEFTVRQSSRKTDTESQTICRKRFAWHAWTGQPDREFFSLMTHASDTSQSTLSNLCVSDGSQTQTSW